VKTTALLALALPLYTAAADKPRIFLTESHAQVTAEGVLGEEKSALAFSGGTSSETIEVMKAFGRLCPAVVITANRDRADYIVRFDREGTNPTTPFVKGNKVAIFNRDEDLVYSHSTRLLGNAVKGACTALTRK
jgi:hypothetical protein